MDFIGTAGKDQFSGSGEDDHFDMGQGGQDKVLGGGGDDTIDFGAALTAGDKIDGGGGFDTLIMNGDYSGGLTFADDTLVNIEWIELGAGHSYTLEFGDANFTGLFVLDGRDLGVGESLVADARADTDTRVTMFGGAGNDTLRGGLGNDSFILTKGGTDTANGGDGSDGFAMGGTLDVTDQIDGGLGPDLMTLLGDYSAGLTIDKHMVRSIETIVFSGDFDYDITLANKVINGSIAIDASGIGAGHGVTFDAHSAKSGGINFTASAGTDFFTGGDGNDTCDFSLGGKDTGHGGAGNDVFIFGATFHDKDKVDGGDGFDSLLLNGDYSAGFTFKQNAIDNIEQISLFAGHSYDITMVDGNVAAGKQLSISASGLTPTQVLTFDGTAEIDGRFLVTGGAAADIIDGSSGDDTLGGSGGIDTLNGHDGDDTLAGGTGDDILNGGAGADRLNGSTDNDTFLYADVSESTGVTHDTFVTFGVADSEGAVVDKLDLAWTVTGVDDAVTDGALNEATFDADLAAAVGANELAADHAVLFTADDGDLEGKTFLIVEHGGGAGYQAGQDLVIQIEQILNADDLATGNFI